MADGKFSGLKRRAPVPRMLSLEDFRRQYAKRVFELLGRDERKTASVLGVEKEEFTGLSNLHPA